MLFKIRGKSRTLDGYQVKGNESCSVPSAELLLEGLHFFGNKLRKSIVIYVSKIKNGGVTLGIPGEKQRQAVGRENSMR